jgi:hypothetical protein
MLLATGEFGAVIKVIWHYFHCKTARVASGENSLSSDALSVSSNLLTGSMAYCSHKVFQKRNTC